jgi:hypothetical protein
VTSRIEQETIVCFNEAESSADIETFNGVLTRKLARLSETRPGEVTEITDAFRKRDGAVRYTFPKKWLRINPSRLLSDEEKERRRMNAQNMHRK